jgi:hypothetical protein
MTTSRPLRTFHGRTILILEDNLDARDLLPCIAVTAYPDVFPLGHARGFDGYMRKPLDLGALCNLAASLLR